MKNLMLIITTCLISSCGQSVYYAYEFRDAINDHYSYCTLEITPKKEIIYRASSDDYFVYNNNVHAFVCIHSDKDVAKITNNYYGFGATTSNLWTIEIGDNPERELSFLHFDYPYDASISYLVEKENDTIKCTTNDFEYLKKGYGYKEKGVLWFPEYMVKVNQIDYNKFYKSVRHMDLKNAHKIKN
jgi:hypothetical protein